MDIFKNLCGDGKLCTENGNLPAEIEHTVTSMSNDKSYVFLAPIINYMYFNKKPYIYLNRAFYRDLVKSYESCNSTPIKITSDGFQQKLSHLENQKLLIKINPPNCVNKKNCFRLSEKFTIVENQEEIIAREKSVLSSGASPFACSPVNHSSSTALEDINLMATLADKVYREVNSHKAGYGEVLDLEIVSQLSAISITISKASLTLENIKAVEAQHNGGPGAKGVSTSGSSKEDSYQGSRECDSMAGNGVSPAKNVTPRNPSATGGSDMEDRGGVIEDSTPRYAAGVIPDIASPTERRDLRGVLAKGTRGGEGSGTTCNTKHSEGANDGRAETSDWQEDVRPETIAAEALQEVCQNKTQEPSIPAISEEKPSLTSAAMGLDRSDTPEHAAAVKVPDKISTLLSSGTDLAINIMLKHDIKRYNINKHNVKNNVKPNNRAKLVSNETNALTFSINSNYLNQKEINQEIVFSTNSLPVDIIAVLYGLISSKEMFLVGILNKFYTIEDSNSEKFMLKYNIHSNKLSPQYSSLPELIRFTLNLTDNNILKTTNIIKLLYVAMYIGHYKNNNVNFVKKDPEGKSYKVDLFSVTSEIKKLCSETEEGVKFKKKFMFMLNLVPKIVTGGVKKNLKKKPLTKSDFRLREKFESENLFEEARASKYVDKFYGEYLSSITVRLHDSFCCIPEGIQLETQSNDKLKKYMSENYEFCTMFPLSENIIKYYNNKRNNISEIIRKISMQTKTKT